MAGPLVFAHRGYTETATENTVAAFEAAQRLGADGVELDVRRSVDWGLVVHHGAEIAGRGPISEIPVRDLPPTVPLLAEALEACQGMVVNVEIKHDPDADPDRALAGAVVTALAEAGWSDRVVVSSFDAPTVDLVRNAGLVVGWLLEWSMDAHAALVEAVDRGYQALHPFVTQVDERLVDDAHAAGLAVNVWTVNAPGDLAAMVEWGVDGVVTDRLVEALAVVHGGERSGERAAG